MARRTHICAALLRRVAMALAAMLFTVSTSGQAVGQSGRIDVFTSDSGVTDAQNGLSNATIGENAVTDLDAVGHPAFQLVGF